MKLLSGSSNSDAQLQELISHIYDAALEPEKWKNVLNEIAHLLNAEQAYMRIINTRSNDIQLSHCYNKDPYWVNAYKDYFVHMDPWLNSILKAKDNYIACTHHYFSDKHYESMEFYRDFVEPQGTHFGLGGKIQIGEDTTNYLALNRRKKRQGFEYKEYRILQLLVPHIQKSILLNAKTRDIKLQHNLLRDALNLVNSPLLLVNKNGKVLFINSLAEQIIEQQDGINIKNNHFCIRSQVANKKLQKLIHQATDPHSLFQLGGALHYTHSVTQTSTSILISPINPDMINNDTQSHECALLVLSSHIHQPPISAENVSSFYNLTPAEARLAVELCQGLSLNEIAEKFSLSKNTLRTQLRSCFNKTGVSRQADLIRLIDKGSAGIIKKIQPL